MPDVLRQQIYAEEEQRIRKKRVDSAAAPSERHPIQITNVLPVHPQTESVIAQKPAAKRLDIPGLHDVNVQDYCNWLQARVQDESQKAEYQEAADFLRRKAFDLDLLYENQDPSFLVEQGEVEVAIARRFVKDIPLWAELEHLLQEAHLVLYFALVIACARLSFHSVGAMECWSVGARGIFRSLCLDLHVCIAHLLLHLHFENDHVHLPSVLQPHRHTK